MPRFSMEFADYLPDIVQNIKKYFPHGLQQGVDNIVWVTPSLLTCSQVK